MQEKFYSIAEVAEKLDLSQKAVRRLVACGELASVKNGSSYSIAHSELDNFSGYCKDECIEYDLFGEPILPVKKKKSQQKKRKIEDDVNWVDISKYWESAGKSSMTYVDLFCGAGGLSKGLEMAGLQGICGLDWFEEAGLTYVRNFNHPFINGDIKAAEIKRNFYETVKLQLNGRNLGIVAGGFPCQGFSMAGNRIVDDPRNSLYLGLGPCLKPRR